MRNTRKEQMISALPPTSDIARQPRLTIESHLRLNPPASRCRAAGGCRLSTSPLAGPPAPAPRGLTSRVHIGNAGRRLKRYGELVRNMVGICTGPASAKLVAFNLFVRKPRHCQREGHIKNRLTTLAPYI